MRHGGADQAAGILEWQPPGADATERNRFELPEGGWGRFRWPVTLEGLGIDFTQIRMLDQQGNLRHERRLFTHLKRPPRVLAVGGDWRWVSAMEGSGIEIIRASPEDLDLATLDQIDAVVINDVAGPQLDPRWITRVVRKVPQGLGLFVVNGDHSGLDEKDETVYVSLADTQLGEVLPLKAGPRPFRPKGSKRQIVVLVDASGSMGSQKMKKAKEIIQYVIETHLGPEDTLDLIAFSTRALHMVETRNMDEAGKQFAIEKLTQLTAGGGTDPRDALALIRDRNFTDCGMLFLSDGEFGSITIRPECRATVFAIGKSSVPANSPLYELADPFPVTADFDPRNVRLPYFQPEGRNKYFEAGNFRPLRLLIPQTAGWDVPRLNIDGAAITHLEENSQLVAVRPKLTDPVLAFRKIERGMSLAFTGALAGDWIEDPRGQAAVQQWISRLIAYKARDRYDFQLSDYGSFAEMTIALHDKDGSLPDLEALRMRLEMPGASPLDLVPFFEDVQRGEWRVRLPLPAGLAATGQLIITEYGNQALNEPQAVPIRLPAATDARKVGSEEPFHWGIHESFLRLLAEASGGAYQPAADTSLFPPPILEDRVERLWQWFALAAMICYLGAIACTRIGG
jgi:hypothetical protein